MAQLTHREYTIRWATGRHAGAFVSLHDEIFGTWGTDARAQYDWKYVENPFVDGMPVVVVEDGSGDVVGARGYFALPVRAGDRGLLGLQSSDLMVHPDHRRQGLFRQMNAFGISAFEDENALFFSFPGASARQGYTQDGWTAVENPAFLRPLDWEPAELSSPTDVVQYAGATGMSTALGVLDRVLGSVGEYEVTATSGTVASLLSGLYERHVPRGIHAERTETFYEWRLAEPRQRFTTYVARREGRIAVAAVVSEDDGTLQVRDILPYDADAAAIAAVLRHVARSAADADVLCAWRPAAVPVSAYLAAGLLPETVVPTVSTGDDIVTLGVPDAPSPSDSPSPSDGPDSIGTTPAGTDPADWDVQLLERDY